MLAYPTIAITIAFILVIIVAVLPIPARERIMKVIKQIDNRPNKQSYSGDNRNRNAWVLQKMKHFIRSIHSNKKRNIGNTKINEIVDESIRNIPCIPIENQSKKPLNKPSRIFV